MATSTKRAKRVRTAGEFNPVKLAEGLKPPRFTGGAYAWDLDAIRAARQQQMEGNFQLPAKLAEAQKSDDGIFTALRNRLSPARGLPVGLIAANASAKAQRIKDEAEALYGIKGVGCPSGAFSDINECIADHGVAFGVNVLTPRADGSRVDIEHTYWPIEHVYWDRTIRAFVTRLDNGQLETICHGDGRWTIYTQHSSRPWRWGALLSTALIWADRQFGVRDRSRASTSHGNAKMIGELPEGVAIDSPEGEAFLMLLRTMHEALPYGIRPAGSKTEMMVNQSASWQIFKEIIDSRLGDAARVYLGHDGTIRAGGGNYIKDGYLFGVSADIVEADLRTMERGFYEGVLQPWTALNFGDSSLAPMRRWLMPDADEDTRRASIAERRTKFWADLAAARAAGVVVDQAFVNALADEFGVRAPQLAEAAPLPTPEAAQPDGGEVQASEAPTDEAAAHLAAKMTEAGLERCEHQRSNRCWMCGIERVRDFEVVDGKPTWKVAWRPIGDVSVTAATPTFLS